MRPSTIMMSVLLAAGSLGLAQEGPPATTPATPASPADAYAGDDVCKDCHESIWTAWDRTKHATAFERLADTDRGDSACVACHATGTPEILAAQGSRPKLPHVQCESCHGAGAAHAAAKGKDAKAPARIAKAVPASTCIACHNAKSPHYKGFFYTQMKELVHKVRKPEPPAYGGKK